MKKEKKKGNLKKNLLNCVDNIFYFAFIMIISNLQWLQTSLDNH